MAAQLEKTGLPCRFIEAIDGTQLRDVQEYSSLKRRLFFGRDLTAGEIGCLLSHRKTYKTIIDENIPCALILEDDAILSPDLPNVLSALMRHRDEWDMIRFLGSAKAQRQARVLSPLDNVYSLARPCGTPGGAYAYLIHTQAAEKLYRLTRRNYTPIDTLHGYLWRTRLRTLMLVPSPVKPDMEVPSTIGAARFSKKTDLPVLLRPVYPLTRAWMKLYEALFKHGTALALHAADALSTAGRKWRNWRRRKR